jgi:hypothetical protein
LNTARAAVEQEFLISERLDTKARALVVLAGQWFAVAQAVSAVAFATKKPHDWMLWTVAGTALVGAIALALLFFFCWRVWRIRDESPRAAADAFGCRARRERGGAPRRSLRRHAPRPPEDEQESR